MAFPAFWEDFTTAIDQNPKIGRSQKFILLKNHLADEPRKLLDAYHPDSTRYEGAKQALVDLYNNREFQLTQLLEDLKQFKTIHNFDLQQLKTFNNKVQEFYEFLHHGDKDAYFRCEEYFKTILSRVPPKVGDPVRERRDSRLKDPELTSMKRHKMNFDDIVGKLNDYTIKMQKYQQERYLQGLQDGSVRTSYATWRDSQRSQDSMSGTGGDARSTGCAFCSGDHETHRCDKSMSARERYDIAEYKRLCYKCLRKWTRDHIDDCTIYCYTCKDKGHNRLLCVPWSEQPRRSTSRDRNARDRTRTPSRERRPSRERGRSPDNRGRTYPRGRNNSQERYDTRQRDRTSSRERFARTRTPSPSGRQQAFPRTRERGRSPSNDRGRSPSPGRGRSILKDEKTRGRVESRSPSKGPQVTFNNEKEIYTPRPSTPTSSK